MLNFLKLLGGEDDDDKGPDDPGTPREGRHDPYAARQGRDDPMHLDTAATIPMRRVTVEANRLTPATRRLRRDLAGR